MSLTAIERDKYETLADAAPQYRDFSPAERYLPVFLDVAKPTKGATVLDAGCCTGKGGLFLAQHGLNVTLCDLTDVYLEDAARALPFARVSLWHDLWSLARGKGHPNRTAFHYVVCCDVLEHIPIEYTMLVVRNLLAVASSGVFLSIALVPDGFGMTIGEPLHQTVQPFAWWRSRLAELGDVEDARDLLDVALFYVRPSR